MYEVQKESGRLYFEHMKFKGIGLVGFLLVFSATAAFSIGGYFLYKNSSSSKEEFPIEGNQALERAEQELMEVQNLYEAIEAKPMETPDSDTESQVTVFQTQVQQQAGSVSSKDPCSANMNDVEKGLQTAEQALKLGMDELAEGLKDWVQDAVHSIVADASIHWVAAFNEQVESDRMYHAQLARFVGLEEVSEEVVSGDYSSLEEWRREKCKKGCCLPHDGQYTETECDSIGGEWKEECSGFTVVIRGSSHSDLQNGGAGDAAFVFNLHSCGKDVYSTWDGVWNFDWLWTTPDGNKAPGSMLNQPVSFVMSKEGKGTYTLAAGMGNETMALFETDSQQMNFRVEWGQLAPVYGVGKINKGSGLCQE